jgi:hypothetical protein
MFDNLTPNQTNPAVSGVSGSVPPSSTNANPPAEPVDMFAAVKDLPAKPAAFQPKNNLPPIAGLDSQINSQENMKKYFVLIVIVLVIILLIAGAFISYKYFFTTKAKLPAVNNQQIINKTTNQTAPIQNTTESPAPPENQSNIVKEPEQPAPATTPTIYSSSTPAAADNIDTDHDGLTDAEEIKLGTDPAKADSDDDGLLDNEEIKIYKTNPLNPDTDGDGFLDGAEVKSGYNPLGPGKLYKVKP